MPEEEAFCILVRLMNHYHLRDLFIQDMPGLHMHLYQFERLLEDLEPALYCHLHRRSITPHLYATQWFLTLFSYRFPLQLVLRIYDLIFSEGLSAIIKFGIVLMQKNATTLLGMSDMSQLTNFLKDRVFDVYIDATPSSNSILENGFFGSSSASMDKEVYRADQLVHDACAVKITPELLKFYRTEWEEKTRAEKERETELDGLKMANASYAIQVRRLEERIEAVDREQATLATELVHTKVDNEGLKDENESLKGQVRELRIVIDQQPVEIEEKWKLERDDLMKRNQKVHEENERVEKELSDLEEQLVQTKLRYAEVSTATPKSPLSFSPSAPPPRYPYSSLSLRTVRVVMLTPREKIRSIPSTRRSTGGGRISSASLPKDEDGLDPISKIPSSSPLFSKSLLRHCKAALSWFQDDDNDIRLWGLWVVTAFEALVLYLNLSSVLGVEESPTKKRKRSGLLLSFPFIFFFFFSSHSNVRIRFGAGEEAAASSIYRAQKGTGWE